MFRLNPGNNARIRERTAKARLLREMVRDKPAKLAMYSSMRLVCGGQACMMG